MDLSQAMSVWISIHHRMTRGEDTCLNHYNVLLSIAWQQEMMILSIVYRYQNA
jgi:hypothetical protein